MTWTVRLRLTLLVIVTVVLQTTLFPDLRFFGIAPDLGLVAAIAVAFCLGPERGALYGFCNGLVMDLFLQTPLGLSALSFALTGYAAGVVQSGLSRASRWFPLGFGGLGGLAGGLVFVVVGALAGEDQVLMFRTLQVLTVAAAYDALLAVGMFPVARWAAGSEARALRRLAS
jgi:rod shape-determining protein MreD